eukprot:scaffold59491_cov35-Attheya_sp.AAC.1
MRADCVTGAGWTPARWGRLGTRDYKDRRSVQSSRSNQESVPSGLSSYAWPFAFHRRCMSSHHGDCQQGAER